MPAPAPLDHLARMPDLPKPAAPPALLAQQCRTPSRPSLPPPTSHQAPAPAPSSALRPRSTMPPATEPARPASANSTRQLRCSIAAARPTNPGSFHLSRPAQAPAPLQASAPFHQRPIGPSQRSTSRRYPSITSCSRHLASCSYRK
jgi:hypothetical protein